MQIITSAAVAALAILLVGSPAAAEPANCQKQVVKQLLKLKKINVKAAAKCLDAENLGKIAGPCPDAATQLKVQKVRTKVITTIATACPDPDRATLGFPNTCAYETTPTGVEAACAALPVGTPAEFATCLACWKEAELAEFMATLYASHAVATCGGALDETSPTCSELDCATPLPDQRDLGDSGENDCQRAIGKAGIKHLLYVEKTLEGCGLKGNDRATCLADLAIQLKIDTAEVKLDTAIRNKCGNRAPAASLPFCCRTGMANACSASATREQCVVDGGDVQEGKTCGMDNTCDPVGGPNQKITWWETCPISDTCPGTALTSIDDLIGCVDATVDEVTDELLCLQFPSGWPCPPDAS
jgi:hypothetical protein